MKLRITNNKKSVNRLLGPVLVAALSTTTLSMNAFAALSSLSAGKPGATADVQFKGSPEVAEILTVIKGLPSINTANLFSGANLTQMQKQLTVISANPSNQVIINSLSALKKDIKVISAQPDSEIKSLRLKVALLLVKSLTTVGNNEVPSPKVSGCTVDLGCMITKAEDDKQLKAQVQTSISSLREIGREMGMQLFNTLYTIVGGQIAASTDSFGEPALKKLETLLSTYLEKVESYSQHPLVALKDAFLSTYGIDASTPEGMTKLSELVNNVAVACNTKK